MAYSDNLRQTSGVDFEDVADLIDGNYSYASTGWVLVNETWTYASSTTITVPTGAASRYQKGDKLQISNSTTKYFYIITVADTLLTVTGGSDYTVANTTISSVYVSRSGNPFGFPDWFNWSPTLTGFSANPTDTLYRFRIDSKTVTLNVRQGTSGTSNATSYTMTVPVTNSSTSNNLSGGLCWQTFDNSAEQSSPARAYISPSGTTLTIEKTVASGAWTSSGGKRVSFSNFSYEF